MKEKIKEQFKYNLERSRNLVKVFHAVRPGGRGKPKQEHVDILRSAVVFTHATLEDLLRSISEIRIPYTKNKETLEKLPFPNANQTTAKFSMAQLSDYRGRSVDDVIEESVSKYLERKSYSNTVEITTALQQCDFEIDFIKILTQKYFSSLDALTKRRHLIVHRADRRPFTGKGKIKIEDLTQKNVNDWIDNVEAFGRDILEQI